MESTLDVGGDSRKIQYCYQFLKKSINDRPEIEKTPISSSQETANPSSDSPNPQPSLSPAEVQRLREILQQRDNEIS